MMTVVNTIEVVPRVKLLSEIRLSDIENMILQKWL